MLTVYCPLNVQQRKLIPQVPAHNEVRNMVSFQLARKHDTARRRCFKVEYVTHSYFPTVT